MALVAKRNAIAVCKELYREFRRDSVCDGIAKIRTIKIIRNLTGQGLKESLQLTNRAVQAIEYEDSQRALDEWLRARGVKIQHVDGVLLPTKSYLERQAQKEQKQIEAKRQTGDDIPV